MNKKIAIALFAVWGVLASALGVGTYHQAKQPQSHLKGDFGSGQFWSGTVIPTTLPPSGTAGGYLAGSYPNPTFLSDAGILAGLSAGGVLSGTYPNPGLLSDAGILNGLTAGGDLNGTYPNPTIRQITGLDAGNSSLLPISFGGTNQIDFGPDPIIPTQYEDFWIHLNGTTPTLSNALIIAGTPGSNSGTGINDSTGAGFFILINGVTVLNLQNGTGITSTLPFGGASGSTFQWTSTTSAIPCGTGGTQTISAGQAATPGLIVTSGTLSSNCVLDFSTNASTGWYVIDMTGVTLGATFGVQFKNGTTTKTFISTSVIAGTLAIVWTHGTNTLAVNF